jgi:hypothetical protein
VSVGSGTGSVAWPDGTVPVPRPVPEPELAPDPGVPGDAVRRLVTGGWVPAGLLAALRGDRPPGTCGPDGAATGGPAGSGVNRTVTVTKKA